MNKIKLLSIVILSAISSASMAADVIVATVGNQNVTLAEIVELKNSIPELRDAPLDQVFDSLREQRIAEILLEAEVQKANLDKDPDVEKASKLCMQMAKRKVFLERQVEKLVTDDEVMALYKEAMKKFKKEREVRLNHILVESEKEAQDIINQLSKGGDFAALARTYSKDSTSAENGGDMGVYITKSQANELLGKDFAETMVVLKLGSYNKKPIKTKFGYHIIKPADSRMSTPPKFEDVEPQLRMAKLEAALIKYLMGLKDKANVKEFDKDGKPVQAKAPAAKK